MLSKLPDVRKNGKGWSARCPAHDDQQPSLSVSLGEDGRVLLHCHAGCEAEAICRAVGLQMKDLYPANGKATGAAARDRPNVFIDTEEHRVVAETIAALRADPGLCTTVGYAKQPCQFIVRERTAGVPAVGFQCHLPNHGCVESTRSPG